MCGVGPRDRPVRCPASDPDRQRQGVHRPVRTRSRPGPVRFDRICAGHDIGHLLTAPRSPTTTGKIERFHRTLADGWAYARFYDSEAEQRAALPGWLHFYNHHRAHSALRGQPPITRLTNLPGHHT
ncbi:MAG: transposase [Cellulomonas sp.]|uniref:integrase core domain-containing protein n=1 Tax=Cellulomonas sp. 73-92 TaxID=1895740 RepID=UPI000AAA1557|nr:integrase core domain-containing protein [Cellulomonas sp. 73-92]MBN9374973.1 transposase [Cellulomonas sp.]